ncbi:hypothetical protein PM082_015785 [Marasmius tenuissimus]|nr:hypothetical protein PM082_015785 [Marasmius tenuissimus]
MGCNYKHFKSDSRFSAWVVSMAEANSLDLREKTGSVTNEGTRMRRTGDIVCPYCEIGLTSLSLRVAKPKGSAINIILYVFEQYTDILCITCTLRAERQPTPSQPAAGFRNN